MSSTLDGVPAEAVVELREAVRRYGSTTAVDRLSLTVRRGESLALLGPNGAGKTSTLGLIEGLARPDAGTVRVFDADPIASAAAIRPRIGVMIQAGGAHLGSTVRQALSLIADCAADPHDPDWLLDVLGLRSVARSPVRRISSGQQQRLGLAMALVGRPELLVLDEPTAGMDPQARLLVRELLRAAQRDGVTILFTTHLLDEAETLADRIVVVDDGRVIAEGTIAELTDSGRRSLTEVYLQLTGTQLRG